MKENYCHILTIIDRSGSMCGLQNEVIGGFNSFIADQKKVEGTATLSLIQFDNMYEVNYEFTDIQDVPDLNNETYVPRGMTAMYDAIGKAVLSLGSDLESMKEENRPEKVIVMIQTDGMENASHEFRQETIKKLITEQEETYSWEFVFLGANIDAVAAGGSIGISASKSMKNANNAQGMGAAFASLSSNMASYRSGATCNMNYTAADFTAQADAGVDEEDKSDVQGKSCSSYCVSKSSVSRIA